MTLVPAWSLLLVPVGVAIGTLWIAAVVSIARSGQSRAGLDVVLWLTLVTLAPVLGPILWFTVGRRQAVAVCSGMTHLVGRGSAR